MSFKHDRRYLLESIFGVVTEADFVCDGFQIVEQGLMSKEDYKEVKKRALALFQYGQVVRCESYLFYGNLFIFRVASH